MRLLRLNSGPGFTLVEILLTLGILGVLAGLTIPLVASLPATTNLETSAGALGSQLRRAQARSVAGWNAQPWGVAFFADRYTVFAGTSYATRMPGEDEVTVLPPTMGLTSQVGAEVLFSPAGLPSTVGSVMLTEAGGQTAVVTIGAAGAITRP